jgi:hypothetical protein
MEARGERPALALAFGLPPKGAFDREDRSLQPQTEAVHDPSTCLSVKCSLECYICLSLLGEARELGSLALSLAAAFAMLPPQPVILP